MRTSRITLVALLLLALQACSSCGPREVTLNVYGKKDLNQNSREESTSVKFNIFQLTDDAEFLAGGFDDLKEKPVEVLAATLVAGADIGTGRVTPDMPATEPVTIRVTDDCKVKFLGVLGRFDKTLEGSPWRVSLPLEGADGATLVFENYEVRKDPEQ